MSSDFEERFTENMRLAGKALEENGYDVVDYHAFIREHNSGISYANHADNPEQALNDTLDEITGEEIVMNIDGADLAEMARGQGDLSQALYQTVNGGISIDEPTVTKEEWTGEAPASEPSSTTHHKTRTTTSPSELQKQCLHTQWKTHTTKSTT
nr:hypothetical protein [Haloferax sp. BAB-2207]